MSTTSKPSWAQLRGISLPIVLIFLAVISLLATVGIRRSTVSEALSRNQMDHEVARQAAEAALRDGERDLRIASGTTQTGALCARADDREGGLNVTPVTFTDTCLRGQCAFERSYYEASNFDADPVEKPQPWWPKSKDGLWNNDLSTKPKAVDSALCLTFVGGIPLGTFTGTPQLSGVTRQPEYLIEYFKIGDTHLYRITARGFGSNAQAEVVLQSYISPD